MKVHGGYGYSTEFEVERLYRDAILMSIGEGTNDILRTVVAKSLVQGGDHGWLTIGWRGRPLRPRRRGRQARQGAWTGAPTR